MIFFKKEENTGNKRFMVVLGKSPLAKFLVYVLKQNNIEVVVLNTSNNDKGEKKEGYVFKSNTQNQSFSPMLVITS